MVNYAKEAYESEHEQDAEQPASEQTQAYAEENKKLDSIKFTEHLLASNAKRQQAIENKALKLNTAFTALLEKIGHQSQSSKDYKAEPKQNELPRVPDSDNLTLRSQDDDHETYATKSSAIRSFDPSTLLT